MWSDKNGNVAALPQVEGKASKRKSKTPERGRSAADEDEDAYQSAKCYFDLKVSCASVTASLQPRKKETQSVNSLIMRPFRVITRGLSALWKLQ